MDIFDKLDSFGKFIEDLYYEFGESSRFFKDNERNLSKTQKEILKDLYNWKCKGIKDILEDFEIHQREVDELERQIEDLEEDNARLEDENDDLQDQIDRLEEGN